MSRFHSRLSIRLASALTIGVIGCLTHHSAKADFSKWVKPKLPSPKLKLPTVKVPSVKLPDLKVPEFKKPELNVAKLQIPRPSFGSKFSEKPASRNNKPPRKFRLISTGKNAQKPTGQTLGGSGLPNAPKRQSPNRDHRDDDTASAADTMALVDEASESVQGAFSNVNMQPIADGEASNPSIHSVMQPRDANSRPDQFRDLSESEMLRIALSRSPILRSLGIRILDNPQAATTIYDVAINANDPFFGPQAALAEFDSRLSASVNSQNNDRVFNNATLGGQVQELTQDLVNINAGWQRRTMTGATWEVNSLTGYDNNNRAGNRFRNYWETQLEAGVRQPLLQGAGRQFNRIAGPNARPGFNFSNGIVIAQMNNQISQADFEISLRSYVRDLYSAYWDLVRQYAVYQSVLNSQELAYETWQTVLAKGKADLEGGEANKEAQARAKYYNYRREVQIALGGDSGRGGLYVAERRLRQLIGLPAVDGQLLRPIDDPVTARFVFDYDHLVARAMKGRMELRRQSTKVRQQQLRLIAAKNFLLPQMDLIGRYRLRGFGDDLTGSGARFSSAYDDFASLDHQEWEFGVEMGVTAGRRQAHAAVRHAQLQLARERVILCEQQRMVRHETSDAFAEVSSAYFAMQSSSEQVAASKERLKASEALFEADKIQIEFLLDAQEELLRAELQMAADQARYSLSLVEINNTSGTLLRDIGVNIAQKTCGTQVHYFATSLTPSETIPRLPAPLPSHVNPVMPADPLHNPSDSANGQLPTPPNRNSASDENPTDESPKLKPAPQKKLPDELIRAPSPTPSLKQFLQNNVRLPNAIDIPKRIIPSRSVSLTKQDEASIATKSEQSASSSSISRSKTSGRVIAKPSFTPSESWSTKAKKTTSQSRFRLPNPFRAVPTVARTPQTQTSANK